MKTLPLLAFVALCGLSSCDKVRDLATRLGKKTSADSSSTRPASEIPKGVLDILPGKPGRIVLVDFYADWCGPCRMLSPILEKVADENSATVSVCKVNVDKFRELATQQGVSGIPDVRIFVDGKFKDKFVGALPETMVRQKLGALVSGLPPAPKATEDPGKSPPKEPAIRPMPKNWLPEGMQRR
ncbi:MAG: thioredoxin domain-containing protein [Verrucomicrobiota bacterium]